MDKNRKNPSGVLTPAYRRDYKSKKAIEADFKAGKDFVLNGPSGSGYVSINNYTPGFQVQVRYGMNRFAGGYVNTTVIKVPEVQS